MEQAFAYLSGERVNLKEGSAVRQIESQFAESVRSRAIQIYERNAWKTEGTGAQFMRGGLLWGQRSEPVVISRITGLCRGCNPGEMVYSLETNEVGGVFVLRDGGKEEQRLFHTSDFRVRHVAAEPNTKMIAFTLSARGGTSSIATMHADGGGMSEITQGDTLDEAPSWVPGSDHEVVFQSAGIGRNEVGLPIEQGPFAIHKIDVEQGELTTLAADPHCDLLAPRVGCDGALYYIRRPYKNPRAPVSFWRGLLDFALLPFRLLHALFHYLNFFTVAYTGKSLTTAGDARRQGADLRKMMIWGNLIDASKAAKSQTGDSSALVPDSWQLVRQAPDGSTAMLARSVLSFDFAADGSILYSNGSVIFRLDSSGKNERIHKADLVQQVVAIG